MILSKIKVQTKWCAAWLSVLTMTLSPVALGQESQTFTKQQMQNALNEMGLNKTMTFGDFLKKNKNLFPARIMKEVEPILAEYKNMQMPEFAVTTAKSTDGREIPNIRMSQNGALLNIQWFGEKEKFIKFQNTNLTEIDIVNFTDMIGRIVAGDAAFRKPTNKSTNSVKKNKPEFSGYPVLDATTWKSMTIQDRVSYMIQLRHLWLDARNVLIEKNKLTKGKKTAATEINFNFLEKAWAILAGFDAEAAGKTSTDLAKEKKEGKAAKGTVKAKAVQKSVTQNNGPSCLIAGYVTSYNGGVCDHKLIEKVYKTEGLANSLSKKCKESSKMDQIACNPYVYGTPNGEPICITPGKSDDFQKATHFEGPCDRASRLQKTALEIDFLKNKDLSKKQGRYDADNLLNTDEERREIFRKEQAPNYEETQKFIEGLMKSNNKEMKDLYVNGVLTPDGLTEMLTIQGQFKSEIETSTKACKAATDDPKAKHEKNFLQACDQLHRRFLFVAELVGKNCKDNSVINAESLQCICTDESKTSVMPGASCKVTPPPVVTPPVPVVTPVNPEKPNKPDGCEPGYVKEPDTTAPEGSGPSAGAVIPGKCKPIKTDVTKSEKEECGFLCKSFGILKKWVFPLTVTALIGYGIYRILRVNKPALNAAADLCPGTTSTAPCPSSCYPKANINGVCQCALCAVGQSISDTVACTCSTGTTTTTTTTFTCWDGSIATTSTACPIQQLTCPDGVTKVTNLLNCPTTTTVTKPVTDSNTGR
ncbi:MAG: hypothetical protein WA160_03590 [Pseudobdellovibrio sp.]